MKLLVDTSALLALFNPSDENHAAALAFARGNPRARYLTTDLVLAELATRLRARAGAAKAVAATRDLLRSARYDVVFIDAPTFSLALDEMARFSDKRLSLVDCASFALMKRLALATAFTFDRDFRDCGFRMVP